MDQKTKICWGADIKGTGNAYGYNVHNTMLRKYVSDIANITQDADDIILILSPEFYTGKIEGKRNWLFTMFEGTSLPEVYQNSIKKADYLLVPSTWVRDLFSQYFDPNKIFVVNHGVEIAFKYKKRKVPVKKPFRFLWVGAPNPRKGWEEIIHLWKHVNANQNMGIELYIKTTKVDKFEKNGNVILDGRNLSKKQLIDLYHSAHAFLSPHRGEGFGLTLAEAMATGLPCVATDYSGVKDFFDKTVGFPIGYSMGKGVVTFVGSSLTEETQIAYPNVDEMFNQMKYIVHNYKKALSVGENAMRRIKTQFTWQKSAQTLINYVEQVQFENT